MSEMARTKTLGNEGLPGRFWLRLAEIPTSEVTEEKSLQLKFLSFHQE